MKLVNIESVHYNGSCNNYSNKVLSRDREWEWGCDWGNGVEMGRGVRIGGGGGNGGGMGKG